MPSGISSILIFIIGLLILIHAEDVVRLSDMKFDDKTVSGEVNFFIEDNWRTLSARLWGMQDGNVVCHTLGFPNGVNNVTRRHLASDEPKHRNWVMFFVGLRCEGKESSVVDCPQWKSGTLLRDASAQGIAIVYCNR